jgi:hypothetical protein
LIHAYDWPLNVSLCPAPLLHLFFRPEEEHLASGEHNPALNDTAIISDWLHLARKDGRYFPVGPDLPAPLVFSSASSIVV